MDLHNVFEDTPGDAFGTDRPPAGVPLRSTARVVETAQHSLGHQDVPLPLIVMWERGMWLANPNGGLSWVLLACFVLYNCCQLLRHLRKGVLGMETTTTVARLSEAASRAKEALDAPTAPLLAHELAPDMETKEGESQDTGPVVEAGVEAAPQEEPPSASSPPCQEPVVENVTEEPKDRAPDLTAVEVEALRELKESLQDVKMWVEDSAHSAASRNKEHLTEALAELRRILDSSIYSQPRLEAAMRDAFGPLQATLTPSLNGLKSTLGPYPEHGADIRSLRDVTLAVEDFASKALKAVEDTAWDQNGRLNAIGTQVGTVGSDLQKGLQHAHRKLDSIHSALGTRPGHSSDGGGSTDVTTILVAVKDLQTEMKALNQNMEQLQTKVQYVEGRMETALTKLVVVEQSTNKLAAARPKAPPPNVPAPTLPTEEAPLPPPTQPPGQWQPPATMPTGPLANTPTRPTSIPAPSVRLAPHVQLLQTGTPGAQTHVGLPMPAPVPQVTQPITQLQQQVPSAVQGGGGVSGTQNGEMVNLVWNGQIFPVPAAAVHQG
ncbi:unnamed protein product [Symbiodinium sp. CCMP2592]|nr:unnamed protein product [Symbiodinium sp. CCMP2592]